MRPTDTPPDPSHLPPRLPAPYDPLQLITGEELAAKLCYPGVTSGFRAWCTRSGIKPVPGRHNVYDPKHVRARLDELQGIALSAANLPAAPLSLTEQRRARRGTA